MAEMGSSIFVSEPKNDNSCFDYSELSGVPFATGGIELKLSGTPQVSPDESAYGKTGGTPLGITRYESKTGGTPFAKQFKV